ncbi:MAG: hypothetical protein JSR46_05475 [Verrucomicrobia bacterium]|nr:hypothetical protein [Verrucomicrobiota bacterium]
MDIQQLVYLVIALIVMVYYSTVHAPKRGEDEEEEEPSVPPPPPRQSPAKRRAEEVRLPPVPSGSKRSQEKFVFHSSMDQFHQESAVAERKLTTNIRSGEQLVSEELRLAQEGVVYKRKKSVPIANLFKTMPKKNTILIAKEVLDVPVAFRKSPFPRDI